MNTLCKIVCKNTIYMGNTSVQLNNKKYFLNSNITLKFLTVCILTGSFIAD